MDKANEIIEREVRSSRPGSPEPHTIELHDDAYRGSAALGYHQDPSPHQRATHMAGAWVLLALD